MTVPKAQQDPVLKAFDLRRFKISTKAGCLSIVAPSSMEPLVAKMTELDDRARNERMPFWAEIWPSSVASARLIAKRKDLVGKRVVDFGCGVGAVAAAAAAAGADVTCLDFFEEAVAFARFNATENRCDATSRVGGGYFDWKTDRLQESFDLMVCADSVYEPRNHDHVLENIERALQGGGEAWVVDPQRESAEPFFEEAARRFDTVVDEVETHWPDRSCSLRRMTLRRR